MHTLIRWLVLSVGVLGGLLVAVANASAQVVVVGYAAPPVVAYAAPAPVVATAVPYSVTTTRYGLFGRRGYTTVDYGVPVVAAPVAVAAPVVAYYAPPVARAYYAPPVARAYYAPPPVIVTYPR